MGVISEIYLFLLSDRYWRNDDAFDVEGPQRFIARFESSQPYLLQECSRVFLRKPVMSGGSAMYWTHINQLRDPSNYTWSLHVTGAYETSKGTGL